MRSIARTADSTAFVLGRSEDKARLRSGSVVWLRPHPAPALLQLRREIPEAVVSAQALLDEQLPLMRNVASGAGALLQQVQAAVAAHDAQLPAKQQQLNKVAETLIVQQDNVFVLAAEAQRERHEQEIRAAVLAARQDAMRHGQHS